MRIAVIDIGTVTTRLLIANVTQSRTNPDRWHIEDLEKEMRITHLGEGLSESGLISEDAKNRVIAVLRIYAEMVSENAPEKDIWIATSAVRDASNGEEFLEEVSSFGIDVRLISGELEAELSYEGATFGRGGKGVLVADPGGGSTELVFMNPKDGTLYAESINVGARRLTDMFIKHDPVTEEEYQAMGDYIDSLFAPYFENLPSPVNELVVLAGTATTLVTIKYKMAQYDKDFVQGQRITAEELDEISARLARKSLHERQEIVGLEPERAHVAPAGGLILKKILEHSGLDQMTISDNDILYGVALAAAQNKHGI